MQNDMMDLLPVPAMEFKAIYDDAGAIVDLEFLWANGIATATLSRSGDPLNGQTILELYPTAVDMLFYQSLVKTIDDNENQNFHVKASDASPIAGRHVKFATRPSEQGCFVLMNDVTDVVTERDEARGQLKMMEAACNDAVHGIAIANKDQITVYANPALHKMLGYDEGELFGVHVSKMVAESSSADRRETAKKILSDEINQYIKDRTYVKKNGEEITVSVAVSTIHDYSENEQLSLAHFRDVSEERMAKIALHDALEKAEEGTRLKSEFLANMSHEIRTPLNGVIGMAQVLSYSDLSEQQAEHVAIIRDSGANLMGLLNDILDLSKVEAGKIDVTPIEVDVRHKMNRVYKLHEPIAREKGISLDIVVHPGLPSRLKIDPVRLHQCLSNLVSNAVKFTSQGSVMIAIKSEPVGRDHKLTIHVSDTGIGIATEKLGHIFDSFQQADGSTTRSYGGTGLGLTITRRLAELMGGTLQVVSEEGRGSVFTLTLLAGGEDEMGVHQERLLKEGSSAGFADCRVLIVDDNVINRTVATSFLKPYGFVIEEAVDGINALEMLKEKAYDLVLMDVHMPEMNGVTAVRNLREVKGDNQKVPVIALTADAMSGDRERYLEQGMDGYVSKPIDDRVR